MADFLHGIIPITHIEKVLMGTQEMSRLHNILQNSTAYFTYPSNRTSRFSHSLGAMHLGGKIVHNGVVNAKQEVRGKFLTLLNNMLVEMCQRLSDDEKLRRFLENADYKSERLLDKFELNDAVLYSVMPAGISDSETCTFLLVYQAVRIYALTHDIGHPPFSHVIEDSLGEVGAQLKEKDSDSLNPAEKYVFDRLFSMGVKTKPIHEQVGSRIVHDMLYEVLLQLAEATDCPNAKAQYGLIYRLVCNILDEPEDNVFSDVYRCLHLVVDGEMDCDRLDYVARDSVLSAAASKPAQTERLVDSFILVPTPEGRGVSRSEQSFSFLPSVRALRGIEEFFWNRFTLYKFVIYHHRVAKFDGLLSQSVTKVATENLMRLEEAPSNERLLPRDLSGMWHIFAEEARGSNIVRQRIYIQWDDAWLLDSLRAEHLTDESKDDVVTHAQLEEILTNKKLYYPLFKRLDTFRDVEDAFLDAARNARQTWKSFESRMLSIQSVDETEVRFVLDGIRNGEESQDNDSKPSRLYLHELVNVLRRHGKQGRHGCAFVEKSAQKLAKKHGLQDVMIVPKRIKPGLSPGFTIASEDGNPVELTRYSTVVQDLRMAATLFPPFFVFLLPNAGTEIDPKILRSEFGRILWDVVNQIDS